MSDKEFTEKEIETIMREFNSRMDNTEDNLKFHTQRSYDILMQVTSDDQLVKVVAKLMSIWGAIQRKSPQLYANVIASVIGSLTKTAVINRDVAQELETLDKVTTAIEHANDNDKVN